MTRCLIAACQNPAFASLRRTIRALMSYVLLSQSGQTTGKVFLYPPMFIALIVLAQFIFSNWNLLSEHGHCSVRVACHWRAGAAERQRVHNEYGRGSRACAHAQLDKDGDGNIEAAEVQAFLGVKN